MTGRFFSSLFLLTDQKTFGFLWGSSHQLLALSMCYSQMESQQDSILCQGTDGSPAPFLHEKQPKTRNPKQIGERLRCGRQVALQLYGGEKWAPKPIFSASLRSGFPPCRELWASSPPLCSVVVG